MAHRSWLWVMPAFLLLLTSAVSRGSEISLVLVDTAPDCTGSISLDDSRTLGFSLPSDFPGMNDRVRSRATSIVDPPANTGASESGTLAVIGAGLLGLVLLRRRVLH